MKAKYIGKHYDNDFMYLEYEYRGEYYEVYQHKSKGSEPLKWQHANAQSRIDKRLDTPIPENTESVQESLDYFFDLIDGG